VLSPDSLEQDILKSYEELPELTPEEVEAAILDHRSKKFTRQKIEEYNAKIKTAVSFDKPNARELYEALRKTKSMTGQPFKLTDWNKNVVYDLCLYFANDPKFNDRGEGYSLEKGIFLCGTPGAGKSHLMSAFRQSPLTSYKNVTCKSIAEKYRTNWNYEGVETLAFYSYPLKPESENIYGQDNFGYCFGDLGTEDEKNNFGNKVNVMEHIILQRYENKLDFNLTHITTNLNADEIEARYGIRFRDRLKEMCNQIVLEGPSFR